MFYQKKYAIALFALTSLLLFYGYIAETDEQKPERKGQVTKKITAEEANELIQKNKNNPDFIILDVRTPEEYAEERLEDSTNLDFYSETFKEELNKLDKNRTYLTHCRSGGRSSKAVVLMKELGFQEVYDMGGITQWKYRGYPTVN